MDAFLLYKYSFIEFLKKKTLLVYNSNIAAVFSLKVGI